MGVVYLYIITSEREVRRSSNTISCVTVLDTKDMVEEVYWSDDLIDIVTNNNLEVVGLFNYGSKLKLIPIDETKMEPLMNGLTVSHSVYFSNITDSKLNLVFIEHILSKDDTYINRYDTLNFSIDLKDFNVFNKYLASINKFIRYDSDFTINSVCSFINTDTQYLYTDSSRARSKVLFGVMQFAPFHVFSASFCSNRNYLDIGRFKMSTDCTFDSKFFDKLKKRFKDKHLEVYQCGKAYESLIFNVGILFNNLDYVYTDRLTSKVLNKIERGI